jgi:glycerate 2-kinase
MTEPKRQMNKMTQINDSANFLRSVFSQILQAMDAKTVVENAVRIENNRLIVAENKFDLREISGIYGLAIGKAACWMAQGLSESLGEKFSDGVISSPEMSSCFVRNWKTFHGGHPAPNDESLLAAQSAVELLRKINSPKSLVIFLISGGGSAMFEMSRDEKITLADLKTMNQIFVTCGATIAEINALRRRVSAVKNGGLSRFAAKSPKISLIISDTNRGEAYNVASGLTIENQHDFTPPEIQEIILRYRLNEKLPSAVYECLQNSIRAENKPAWKNPNDNFSILLENFDALINAKKNLASNGLSVEIATDLIEQEIGVGCAAGVAKLTNLFDKNDGNKAVAIISGGEFVCPVRGNGTGGRNLESALRTAILFDEVKRQEKYKTAKFTALFAGTDGIDGNSPAAGAICDETTLERGQKLGLAASKYLENSDSYHYFHALGDIVATGASGTNVRDVRILLAL